MQNKAFGFYYHVTLGKIHQYQGVPIEKRLAWLYAGNVLRMKYPKRIRQIQDKFRHAEI